MSAFRLLIVTGTPASGKTEVVDRLQASFSQGWAFVRGDEFMAVARDRAGAADWDRARRFMPEVTLEAVRRAYRGEGQVVYEGLILHTKEVKQIAGACGFTYPHREVGLLELLCSEDTTVERRINVAWDRFGVPRTPEERLAKEWFIRDHYRHHAPPRLAGAKILRTDALGTDEIYRTVMDWFARGGGEKHLPAPA